MRKMVLLVAMLAAVVTASVAAAANVGADGKGFVGKGQVQSAFKWNNAKLQKNASGVSFSFTQKLTERATCDFDNQHITMHRGGSREGSVSSQIAYDPRKNHKGMITGFKLTGIVANSAVTQWGAWALDSGTNSDGQLSLCLSGNDPGPWVTSDSTTAGAIALYVNYNNSSIKLK